MGYLTLHEELYSVGIENRKLKAQRDYWEKEYYEVVDENDKQDEFIKQLKKEIKEASSDVGIFIEEKEELKQRISNLVSENTKLQNDLFSEQRDNYKTERDTLIDDIAVLRANNERYRNRAENAMELAEKANCEVLKLEKVNKDLMIATDNYNTLIKHIRDMSFEKPYSYNYRALVKFINGLEGI